MLSAERAIDAIVDDAGRFYAPAGRFAVHFARGKLRYDPAFAAILARGLIPDRARLADLGCGQGVLGAWLVAARIQYERSRWPADWPVPPRLRAVLGVDQRPRAIRTAEIALGSRARFEIGDIRRAVIPASDAIVLLDVLHYLPPADQEALIRTCARALEPGGVLIARVADPAAGIRFWITALGDRAVTMVRGALWPQFYCRPLGEWIALFERAGLSVSSAPMSAGTPFANVMLIVRSAPKVAARAGSG
jgi:SAM-dependent methyltransferase